MELGLAEQRDWDWKDSLRNEEQDFWSVTGEGGSGTGTSSRTRAEEAVLWCDHQRRVGVYRCMTSSRATHSPRMPNSPCSFASREGYHGVLRVNGCCWLTYCESRTLKKMLWERTLTTLSNFPVSQFSMCKMEAYCCLPPSNVFKINEWMLIRQTL